MISDGKFFQELWEIEKRKNNFDWNNRASKHDAFQVHDFGAVVGAGLKPTSREQGTTAALKMNIKIMEEEKKNDSGTSAAGSTDKKPEEKDKKK